MWNFPVLDVKFHIMYLKDDIHNVKIHIPDVQNHIPDVKFHIMYVEIYIHYVSFHIHFASCSAFASVFCPLQTSIRGRMTGAMGDGGKKHEKRDFNASIIFYPFLSINPWPHLLNPWRCRLMTSTTRLFGIWVNQQRQWRQWWWWRWWRWRRWQF